MYFLLFFNVVGKEKAKIILPSRKMVSAPTRNDAEAKQDNTLRNQATLTRCYRTTRC